MPMNARPALVALVLMSATFAVAAQSLIRQPSAPPPGGGDPRSRVNPAPDYRQYEYGKEIYAVKLGCRRCPLGDQPLDETVAKRVMEDESLRATLDGKEEDAVFVYLRQRFSLL